MSGGELCSNQIKGELKASFIKVQNSKKNFKFMNVTNVISLYHVFQSKRINFMQILMGKHAWQGGEEFFHTGANLFVQYMFFKYYIYCSILYVLSSYAIIWYFSNDRY